MEADRRPCTCRGTWSSSGRTVPLRFRESDFGCFLFPPWPHGINPLDWGLGIGVCSSQTPFRPPAHPVAQVRPLAPQVFLPSTLLASSAPARPHRGGPHTVRPGARDRDRAGKRPAEERRAQRERVRQSWRGRGCGRLPRAALGPGESNFCPWAPSPFVSKVGLEGRVIPSEEV